MQVDIITVYNNAEQYENMIASLKESNQLQYCNLIGIENSHNSHYTSAAKAYNDAIANSAKSEVLIFCHQDIVFHEGVMERIWELCNREKNTLWGAAGVENLGQDKTIFSRIKDPYKVNGYQTLEKDEERDVFTLDELLIAAHKNLFQQLKFDEKTCDNWHGYAVELSLQCQVKGFPVKVFDANLEHLSSGNRNMDFYNTFYRIAKKYRKHYSLITSTVYWTYTNLTYIFYRKARYRARKVLKK